METQTTSFDLTMRLRAKGAGFYVAALAAVAAVIGIVGNAMLGSFATLSTLLLAAGVVLFLASVALPWDLVVMCSYFCYIAAFCRFIAEQLYTISNVLTAIDANSFATSFIIAAAGCAAAMVIGLVGAIMPQDKRQTAA
ncbi:hypothetical protein BLEM_2209 [Bifidobacterium lemurum]|uniref:Uncharacterized protein n=1 Tax=Bifidobacterium lemurum TaxID=1603886 RepID=A0A261FKQ0_9BIFI|nr:hypothetical protein [Bifidobacterium lemurum]OZG59734.1 hypothetical protein BLEM_2209 [Bifidobacterium lemurum]QOL35028.1 hypothetical protein BL8807_03890 [Bifidobacterium lemurum]